MTWGEKIIIAAKPTDDHGRHDLREGDIVWRAVQEEAL
jgi:hypothetical protein